MAHGVNRVRAASGKEGHVTVSVLRHPVRSLGLLTLALIALALALGGPAASAKKGAGKKGGAKKGVVGAVYSETNGVPNNEVIAYNRKANGQLVQRQVVGTGGSGGAAPHPGARAPPDGTGPVRDPQGAEAVWPRARRG